MVKIVGVRFRQAGRVYYFNPLKFDIKYGENVITETVRGIEFGKVVIPPRDMEEKNVIMPLKPILRIATAEDIKRAENNRIKEEEALIKCAEKIATHKLEMKLVGAEYTFDNNKLIFYFTADGRVDFRELVKDLASIFRTRIELRQIGVRDATKLLGGLGICGRPLCCTTYLEDFIPVSIKMAKEQNISLNPTKISGVCGRLMCCLKHEEETYEYLNKQLPNIGDKVTVPSGHKGEVKNLNVLRQKVKVIVDLEGGEKEIQEFGVAELKIEKKRGKKKERIDARAERELAKLEALERKEGKSSLDD